MKAQYKIIFAIVLCLIASNHVFSAVGDTSICPAKDNKAAIMTFTFDDGFINSARFYSSVFKQYGLKGTAGLVTDWIEGGSGIINEIKNLGSPHGTWEDWRNLVAEGYVDIASHSHTHPIIQYLNTQELATEIDGSKAIIEANIPGFKPVGFFYPYGDYYGAYSATVINQLSGAQLYSARLAGKLELSLIPPADWYNLAEYSFDPLLSTIDVLNSRVDSAIVARAWLIEDYHAHDGVGYNPIPGDLFKAHCAYISSKSNQVWCGAFSEVTKYIKESESASIQVVSATSSLIKLNLLDSLDDTIFDYPLTLKTAVNSSWQKVKVLQGETAQLVTPVNESGVYYVYYSAIPDKGEINLTSLAAGDPIVIEVTASPADITADGASVSNITARITDINNNTVTGSGNQVTFSVTGPGTLQGANPVTAAGGIATIVLRSTVKTGTVNVRAKSAGLAEGVKNVNIIAGPAAKIIAASNFYSLIADGTSVSTITARICDANDNTVTTASEVITFTLASGPGTLLGTNQVSAVNGTATIFFRAGTAQGKSTINAVSSGKTGTAEVFNTGTAVKIMCSANPANIAPDGVSASLITAGVYDANNVLIGNAVNPVTFAVKSGAGKLLTDTGDYIRIPANGATMRLRSSAQTGATVVEASGAGLTPGQVTVNCSVGTPVPILAVDRISIDFGSIEQGQTVTNTFNITNTGAGTLTGAITSDKSWINISPAQFQITNTGLQISVSINTTGLATGTNTGTVTVTSNGGTAAVSINVNVTLTSGQDPHIALSTSSLNFGELELGMLSETKAFTIKNDGQGTLTGTISVSDSWITIDKTSLNLAAQVEEQVTVSVDNSLLAQKEGPAKGEITITSNGNNGAQVTTTIAVEFTATCVLVKPNPFRLSSPLAGEGKGEGCITFFGDGIVLGQTTIKIYTLSGDLLAVIASPEGAWQSQTKRSFVKPPIDSYWGIRHRGSYSRQDDNKNEIAWQPTNLSPGIYVYTYESPKEKGIGKFTVVP